MIITRRATRTASALTFQLGSAAYACITLVLLMLMTSDLHKMLSRLNPQIALSLAGAGVLAAATFLLIACAFSRAEASVLAPFQYLEILGATFIGFFAFGDVPDEMTVFGTLVILGSGMYVFHRRGRQTYLCGAAIPAATAEGKSWASGKLRINHLGVSCLTASSLTALPTPSRTSLYYLR